MNSRTKKLFLLALLACSAGCSTDDANSLSRDYRNMNNECIDALMVVTGEPRAKFVKEKIFKAYGERIGVVDKRVDIYVQNADEKDVMFSVVNSESVATLFAENKINQVRLRLEKERLAKLLKNLADAEVERRRLAGEGNKQMVTSEVWPALTELVSGAPYSQLKANLDSGGKLAALFSKFGDKNWQKHKPADFDKMLEQFTKRFKDQEMP